MRIFGVYIGLIQNFNETRSEIMSSFFRFALTFSLIHSSCPVISIQYFHETSHFQQFLVDYNHYIYKHVTKNIIRNKYVSLSYQTGCYCYCFFSFKLRRDSRLCVRRNR